MCGQMLEKLKTDTSAMYLERDALDLFYCLNNERAISYWEGRMKILQEYYWYQSFKT